MHPINFPNALAFPKRLLYLHQDGASDPMPSNGKIEKAMEKLRKTYTDEELAKVARAVFSLALLTYEISKKASQKP